MRRPDFEFDKMLLVDYLDNRFTILLLHKSQPQWKLIQNY